ncbi:hypothetical protein JRO89_XS14G0144700 [Xanthoceras sorbifolium]|uniref:ubiquitinyl hydrolase 1 n=1 Tax=Xanthoceras sorbifolium TaxID=99658 RepID=A0ABQ8H5A6_9ROSI|nr:hypothetical protein JRO89_XS14G0144700 [Xanthoceras sorbifolium]
MQNQEECGGGDGGGGGVGVGGAAASCEFEDWGSFGDEDIMQQKSNISADEAQKIPFVADKARFFLFATFEMVPQLVYLNLHWEPISALAAEYQSGSPILLEKIKILGEQYASIRRTRGDGNCFFRSFMFSYLEHILNSQDQAEVDRIKAKVEECRKTLQSLGYADFTFEDFFSLFLEQLDSVLQGNESSIRFVTSGEIRKRAEFFEPFVMGLTNGTVEQFCKSAVEPMGEESDHVHITALSDALGVPIRVVYLDRSSCDTGGVSINHHDFIPTANDLPNSTSGSTQSIRPYITLLYRPGHYDILYPK